MEPKFAITVAQNDIKTGDLVLCSLGETGRICWGIGSGELGPRFGIEPGECEPESRNSYSSSYGLAQEKVEAHEKRQQDLDREEATGDPETPPPGHPLNPRVP